MTANLHVRDVIYRDRNGTVCRNDGPTDLIHRMDTGVRAQEISFAATLNIIRSDCEIGGLQCLRKSE